MAIFWLTGFTLPSEEIIKGVRDIKLHLFLQLFIFLIIPLYFFFTAFPFRQIMNGYLFIGFYELACLPTTISTCVVFTQMTGGNVVGILFNSSLANLLGVFLSPLILTFLLSGSGKAFPLQEVLRIFQTLALQILLPFTAGQFFHRGFKQFAHRHQEKLNTLSNILVLIIIFLTVSKVVESFEFYQQGKELILPFVYLAGSNVVFVLLAFGGGRLLRFSPENIISALFTAPQKTLGMGIPFISACFAERPEILGIAILPVLFYHPWQLLGAGVVKNSWLVKKKAEKLMSAR